MVVAENTAAIGGRVAMPLFAVSLDASPLMVGLILACHSVIPVFVSILIGRWVDRIGSRRPLLIATFGSTLGLLLPWVFPSLWALAACAAVVGTCMAMLFISIQHAAGVMSTSSNRMRVFTALTVGQSAPALLSPPLTGFLIDTLGYGAAFLGLGMLSLAVGVALIAGRAILPTAAHRPARSQGNLLELLRHPGVRTALIISSLMPLAWEMIFFFVPVQGVRIGLSASTIGLVLSCFSVSLILIRAAVPWLTRRANEWVLITASFASAGGIFMFFPFADSAGVMVALAIVLGACHGVNVPLTLGIVHAASPPSRQAEVLGMRSTVTNSVSAAVPLFLGALTAGIGLGAAALPLGLVFLAGARFAYRRQDRGARRSTSD